VIASTKMPTTMSSEINPETTFRAVE